VGNAAWRQVQLDVYGELLDAAHRLQPELGVPGKLTRQFLTDLANGAAAHWQEADQGIWEIRGQLQHFLYSHADVLGRHRPRHRPGQADRVRPRDTTQVITGPPLPRHDPAVVETDHQVHPHSQPARNPLGHPDDIWHDRSSGHAVHQPDRPSLPQNSVSSTRVSPR
jgi:hypothetical protein